MQSIIDTIKLRSSIRTYSTKTISADQLNEIKTSISTIKNGPFGSKLRFSLLSVSEGEQQELSALRTYGMIKGAAFYLAGVVEKGPKAMEDYGFCMENIILTFTGKGLGTCWLGGTFSRSSFKTRLMVKDSEVLPAVSPIGYPAEKARIQDGIVRFIAGSKNRKAFQELFFDDDFGMPLAPDKSDPGYMALECVRRAPSASNKQPWRIVKRKKGLRYHFFLKENPAYNNAFKDVKMQNIDMGIAMCHFAATAGELGMHGTWNIEQPDFSGKGLGYIATWVGQA